MVNYTPIKKYLMSFPSRGGPSPALAYLSKLSFRFPGGTTVYHDSDPLLSSLLILYISHSLKALSQESYPS